jgi:hypothetical protein
MLLKAGLPKLLEILGAPSKQGFPLASDIFVEIVNVF